MRIRKCKPDFFGSEFKAVEECYDCGLPFKPEEERWESAMKLDAGRITVARCEECNELDLLDQPLEKSNE